MKPEDNHDELEPQDTPSTEAELEQQTAESLEVGYAEEGASAPPEVELSETTEVAEQQRQDGSGEQNLSALTDADCSKTVNAAEQEQDEALSPSVDRQLQVIDSTPPNDVKPVTEQRRKEFFREQPPPLIEVAPRVLRHWTRRDVLLFGAGAIAALAGGGSLLPQATLERLGVIHEEKNWPKKEWFLNRALRIDDDVAEALYSKNRMVPTYTKSQITPLKNNYNGATPDPGYIPEWQMTLSGLASGLSISLNIRDLLTRFGVHEQITRFVCVEGWSAVAWWSGLRFDDLLHAYPPMSQAKWARVASSVNLDPSGNPDPYFVSLDLPTAQHPQTLLATHFNGEPLTVDHGAPLRLLVPVKVGLKNVKAVTSITYLAEEPKDYWAERGYSRYDGI